MLSSLISLLSTLFNAFMWFVIIVIIAIVYLCRWLHRLMTQDDELKRQTDSCDYCGDGSEDCVYGFAYHEQFCANCDLVEQCEGWSSRVERHNENVETEDSSMFNFLLYSEDTHEESVHHTHDVNNCDYAWCECHENDGYSWFDENGNEDDSWI